ncbi:hypothetical protein H632_c2834p0, partial [Helicosporidium sp. ATCC 50920]
MPSRAILTQIITKSRFGEHHEEISLSEPTCIDQIGIGAMPVSVAHTPPVIQVFGLGEDGAWVPLTPPQAQPEAGVATTALPHPALVRAVRLSGKYQTVPLTLRGFALRSFASAAGRASPA